MKILLFISIILSYWCNVCAQNNGIKDSSEIWCDKELEKVFETSITEDGNSTLIEEVARLEENPLDVNTASIEELVTIPGITTGLAYHIIMYREHHPFNSIEELRKVEGMTPSVFPFISRFMKIEKVEKDIHYSVSFCSRLAVEMEKRKGYKDGSYYNSPAKTYNRFRFSLGNPMNPISDVISDCDAGVIMEKDPGEKGLNNFSAGYVKLYSQALATNLIIGDYTVEAAEGLVFWRSSAFTKGSNIIAPTRKNGGGIHSYLSSNENGFFRGIGAMIEFTNIQLQLVYSNKPVNASIDSLGRITTFDKGGLFRTENELRRKNSTRETMVGYRAVVHLLDGLKIGSTGYRAQFDNPLLFGNKDEDVNDNVWMQGVDFSYTNLSVDLFSECAFDRKKNFTVIVGTAFEPIKSIILTMIVRDYPASFLSLHGFAFGESDGCAENERGIYCGAKIQPINWLTVSSYYDQFLFPQPKHSFTASSHGNDFLLLTECQLTRRFEISLRFKQKKTPSVIDNFDEYGRMMQMLTERIQTNYRLTAENKSSKLMKFTSKIEWSEVRYSKTSDREQGILVSQSVRWILIDRLNLHTHIAIFHTDSYDSRIYEYEDDLHGAYSNPALFGRGIRLYIIFRYQLFTGTSVSAKWAQTIKEGVKSIGSGLDEIEGDTQSQASIQIDIRF